MFFIAPTVAYSISTQVLVYPAAMLSTVQSAILENTGGILHGFFTRDGGVSEGPFCSLNCSSSQDDGALVAENCRRVARHFTSGTDVLYIPNICHSANAVYVDRESALVTPVHPADAVVTSERNLPVAVLSADCAPILLADPSAHVVAAVHAGWRGALHGVLDNTVALMLRHNAQCERIVAAIGPCIHQSSYEVGPDFMEKFLEDDKENTRFFIVPPGCTRPHFDLPGYVASRLAQLGVVNCETIPICSRNDNRFFSYRRNCAEGIKGFGCQPSVIMLA